MMRRSLVIDLFMRMRFLFEIALSLSLVAYYAEIYCIAGVKNCGDECLPKHLTYLRGGFRIMGLEPCL